MFGLSLAATERSPSNDTARRCPICGDHLDRVLFKIRSGTILKCLNCQTVRRADLIAGAALNSLYQNEELMETAFYRSNKLADDPDLEPLPTYSWGLKKLANHATRGRLLDVGCSYGAFLAMARQHGWKTVGVELSEKTAAFASKQRGLDVVNSTVEHARFPDDHFQAVTLWDVIEHLDDPLKTLSEAERILSPGGVLVVFTINHDSLLNRVGRLLYRASFKKWQHLMELFYDIHHNFFFTPETLSGLLERTGFEIVEIEFAPAKVERWHIVPIHPALIWGSRILDWLSIPFGGGYRMFVCSRKPL